MTTQPTLSAALEREHHEIDGGIEEYVAGLGPSSRYARSGTGDVDPAPLLRAMAALRRHIYLEEEFIFPPLKDAGMMMPIFVMLREHGEIWDAMDGLDAMLASDADPEAQLQACRELLAQLESHNIKEEPVIYPQADAMLSAQATERLHAFLAEGRMPEGWRCEKAG